MPECYESNNVCVCHLLHRYEPPIDTPHQMAEHNLQWGATQDAWIFSILLATQVSASQTEKRISFFSLRLTTPISNAHPPSPIHMYILFRSVRTNYSMQLIVLSVLEFFMPFGVWCRVPFQMQAAAANAILDELTYFFGGGWMLSSPITAGYCEAGATVPSDARWCVAPAHQDPRLWIQRGTFALRFVFYIIRLHAAHLHVVNISSNMFENNVHHISQQR